jgi:hypothetical protein
MGTHADNVCHTPGIQWPFYISHMVMPVRLGMTHQYQFEQSLASQKNG